MCGVATRWNNFILIAREMKCSAETPGQLYGNIQSRCVRAAFATPWRSSGDDGNRQPSEIRDDIKIGNFLLFRSYLLVFACTEACATITGTYLKVKDGYFQHFFLSQNILLKILFSFIIYNFWLALHILIQT